MYILCFIVYCIQITILIQIKEHSWLKVSLKAWEIFNLQKAWLHLFTAACNVLFGIFLKAQHVFINLSTSDRKYKASIFSRTIGFTIFHRFIYLRSRQINAPQSCLLSIFKGKIDKNFLLDLKDNLYHNDQMHFS